ncbi:MAG: DUF642 domain-containing protein [Thermosynechococcaceae cyanobacterium]
MKPFPFFASALTALFLSASAASAANLIRNGGFEQPIVPTGGFTLFGTGVTTMPHWSIVGVAGNVAIVSTTFAQSGFTFPARSGVQWLDLTGISNSGTGVAQTVKTTAGTTYTLGFSVGNVVNTGGIFGTTSTVNVFINGTQVLTATNSRGIGTSRLNWKKFTTTFVATGTSTTISFINGDPSNDTLCGLDGISLQ